MDFTFPSPTSQGEWLQFVSAAVTVLFGLLLMFRAAPRLSLLRLQASRQDRRRSPKAGRRCRASISGSASAVILLAQPLLYMALGFSWLFTAFGRLVSMMSDGANTPFNWVSVHRRIGAGGAAAAPSFGFRALKSSSIRTERWRSGCDKTA